MTGSPASPAYGESQHYDARYFAWQTEAASLKAGIKASRFAPFIEPTDTVLDFGSAGGDMLDKIDAKRKIGVEINDVARTSSEQNFGLETFRDLASVPDGIADVIVTSHTLEHLANPHAALVELRPKLRPGGRLVVVVPIDDWRTRVQRQWDPEDINRHLYTWSPLLFGNLLDEAGYNPGHMEIVHRSYFNRADRFAWLPKRVFGALLWLASRVRHRQELLAVATVTSTDASSPSA
ncbi:MAG TPA: class I SAM-dependent methyltransferase [Aeromicrobium sp.]|nr:class I SAM-dependent methyltransferase [Aeromicrobium sp.]